MQGLRASFWAKIPSIIRLLSANAQTGARSMAADNLHGSRLFLFIFSSEGNTP